MKLTLEGPSVHQGQMLRTVNQRRGIIIGTSEEHGFARVNAEVPLSEMFGYATVLRSATQGTAEFSMEFERYRATPAELAAKLRKEFESRLEVEDD